MMKNYILAQIQALLNIKGISEENRERLLRTKKEVEKTL
jgi:hypothetical protein